MTNEKPMASWRWLSLVELATIAGIWAALPAMANAAGTDADAGKQIFQEKCAACHTIGNGPLVGPDLKGVTAKEPREWLEQWIAAPDAMLAKKDPVATDLLHQFHDVPMPNLGLSSSDVTAVLAYLGTATAQPSAPAPAANAPAPQGDPEIGKGLFTGVTRFANGGPPCMACHSIGGIGALGGGQLGPDLTGVLGRYGGAAGVNAFVAGTPTPTMKAVWSPHPLTTEERANVVAFLGQAEVTQRPAQAIWQLGGLAALGLVVLLAVAGLRWQNRLRDGVRRPMMATPTTGHSGPYHGGWFPGRYHRGWMARFSPSGNDEPRANVPRRR
jgi:mono/diheme cytochrome c family protein